MTVKIEITSTLLNEKQGVSAKNNKPYHLRIQKGFIWTVDAQGQSGRHPMPFEMMLDADQVSYPVGFYELHESSVQVDRNGRLIVQPTLMPVKIGTMAPKAA